MSSSRFLKCSRLALGTAALAVVAAVFTASEAMAEERKFLVFLANMRRSFPGTGEDGTGQPGIPRIPLPSLEVLEQNYFHIDPDNGLGSFAEWWEEVSYGIIRIDGKALGIVELPWPQHPIIDNEETTPENLADVLTQFSPQTSSTNDDDGTGGYFDLNSAGDFQFGEGERVREERALYMTDFNNTATAGQIPPTQPGFRDDIPSFQTEDLDGDGRLDLGLEDLDGDGSFDLANEDINGNCLLDELFSFDDWFCGNMDGTFTPDEDCDGDGVGVFITEDVDNDGQLDLGEDVNGCRLGQVMCGSDADCAAVGSGSICGPPHPVTGATRCCNDINLDGECVGNEDLDTDGNFDIVNEDSEGDCVDTVAGFPACDGVMGPCCIQETVYIPPLIYVPIFTPGERFRDIDNDQYYDRFFEPMTVVDIDQDNVRNNFSDTHFTLTDGEDYVNTNNDQRRNTPEPLEDFMVMKVSNIPGAGQYAPVTQAYVRNNYPGRLPDLLKRTGNNSYDSPDFWDDRPATDGEQTESGTDSRKLEQDSGQPFHTFTTPEPNWYRDFWRARYGNFSEPPLWNPMTPNLVEFDPIAEDDSVANSVEYAFAPNKGGTGGWGTVLEQMIHLNPTAGALALFGLAPDPDQTNVDDTTSLVFDYNGSPWTYAYGEAGPDEPINTTLMDDFIFGINDAGTAGCLMPDMADPDGDGALVPPETWGCDADQDGDTSELGVFGAAPTWVPTAFAGLPGGLQDIDGDGNADDFLFNPCDIPGHPDCVGGAANYDFPFNLTDMFPPTNPMCACIMFDVPTTGGLPQAEDMCCPGDGAFVDPDLDVEDPCGVDVMPVDCFIPRCSNEQGGSPYYPVPKFVAPAMPDCATPFAKRFGNGTMIELPDNAVTWPGYEEGDDEDPILPPANLVYDGPKEYDDLASSMYHTRWVAPDPNDPRQAGIPAILFDYGGDLAIGEVTTTDPDIAQRNNYGHDQAGLAGPTSISGDGIIIPSGPMAGGNTAFDLTGDGLFNSPFDWPLDPGGQPEPIHGGPGFDGGNQLILELMTRRTDGTSLTEALTGPGTSDGRGFRDFNLDGMIDLGEGRALGTENYVTDSLNSTTNDGMDVMAYPMNRFRLTEDVIEFMDFSEDFDLWINRDIGCGGFTGVHHIILLPEGLPSTEPFAVYSPDPAAEGINTLDDIDNPNLTAPNEVRLEDMLTTTVFSNLGGSLDRNGETDDDQDDGGIGLVAFAAHEYGHYWECWPDLYDYDVFADAILERPIGAYDLMAGSGSGLVHVIPVFKVSSGWIEARDLRTILTPGVPQVINMSPIEFVSDSYYYYEKLPVQDPNRVERFWFYHLQNHGEFSSNLPWNIPSLQPCDVTGVGTFKPGGLMILHTDLSANNEAGTPQQRLGSHFTYVYEQADGQHSMETQFGNAGDAGDPFPGYCDRTEWNDDTEPDNTWHESGESQTVSSGIEITDVELELSGSAVTFLWFPREIPSLRFLQPPGGQSINGNLPLIFRWNDINAGTGLSLFAQRTNPPGNDPGHPVDDIIVDELGVCSVDCYEGTVLNDTINMAIPKDTPGSSSNAINIPVGGATGLADGFYRFYAFLDPARFSPGMDGIDEMGVTTPVFSDVQRRDDVNLAIENLVLDPANANSARLEGWTVTYAGSNQWEVCGSISGLQNLDGVYVPCDQVATFGGNKALALTGQPFTTTNPAGALTFRITNPGAVPFSSIPADRFVFATTGFTAYSEMIEVRDGQVDPGPRAIITVTANQTPCCFPGVRVTYSGAQSTNAEGETTGIVAYRWDIGDDNPVGAPPDAVGPTVNVDYDTPGEFRVRLTVVEAGTNRTASRVHTITISNQAPIAEFTATPDSGPVPLLVTFDASDSFDPDDDNPLMYEWDFSYRAQDGFMVDVGPTADPMVVRSFEEGSFLIALRVTDAVGIKSTIATHAINAGNTPPTAAFTATPGTGTAPLGVIFNASDSADAEDDPLSYRWNFGDGSDILEVTTPITTHVFTETGLFQVSLTVSDGSDVTDVATTVINVTLGNGNVITADMNATPTVGVSPLLVNFTAVASNTLGQALNYRWEFGDGRLASGQTVSHQYVNATEEDREFNAVLVVSDAGGTQRTVSRMITVRPATGDGGGPTQDPNLNIQFKVAEGSAAQGSAPLVVTFDTRGSEAVGGLTFQRITIDFGDGTTRTQQVPGLMAHTYNIIGGQTSSYQARATLFAADGTQSQSTPIAVQVFTSAAPVASFSASPLMGDAPLLVNFDATGSFDPENDTLQYDWNFGDGSVGAGALISHTYNGVGSFNATLTVTDSTGAFDSTSRTLTVSEAADGSGGGLPGGGDGTGQDDPTTTDCGAGCGPMGAAQFLFMLVGLFGLRSVTRRRA